MIVSDNILIKKLVNSAIPDFYESLQLLFTNCDSIPRFPYGEKENNLMVIQGINNLSPEDYEIIHMAEKRWQNQIQNISQEFNFMSSELSSQLNRIPDFLKHPSSLFAFLASKEVIEAATSDFIIDCISKYHAQSNLFDNSDVIRKLSKRLKILEPWSQTNLCSTCEVFEMLFSTIPEKETNCPKCNTLMKTIRVYKLNPELEKLKLENKDLPEFIKEYLIASLFDTSIVSSYQLNGEKGGDIDVYIPKTKTGIECKLFVHPQAEGNYLHSCIGELIKSLKKYVESGTSERLIAVINLDKKYEKQIEDEIKNNLKKNSLPFKEVKVICNSVSSLLETLDAEIKHYRSIPE